MRRNLLRTIFAALIISVFFSVSAYAESAVVTGNGVNFRSGPGTNYYVIATLNSGTVVDIYDRSNGSWYAVSCNGQTGFISSAYLRVNQGSQSSAPVYTAPSVSNEGTGYINAMYVRFRSGPSSQYSVIGTYNAGKAVTILGSGDGWTACVIDGQLGYIYSQYISSGAYVPSGGSSSGSGITVVPGTGSSLPQPDNGAILPQPDNGGITVVQPTITPAPTAAPVVTPAPGSPVVVVTPAPTAALSLPSPNITPTVTPAPTPDVSNGANLPGYIVGSYVRFRSGPGTNYNILGTYSSGKAVTVHSKTAQGWLLCTIDGVNGYVSENYVLIVSQPSSGSSAGSSGGSNTGSSEPVIVQPVVTPSPTPNTGSGKGAYIVGNNVRFRSGPSMSSSILGELFYGNSVTLYAVQNGWAFVDYKGQTGYVYAQYVREGSYASVGSTPGSGSSGSAAGSSSATGQQVVNYALQYLGYNYRWGGASPSTGFDCSGFVYYVYGQFGYTLNRVAQDQARNGEHVHPTAIQPGDILCFYSGSSYIGHVGIYIGDGKFIHASNSTTGVIISELSGHYSSRGYEARRIIT